MCPMCGFVRHRVTHVICGSDLRLCGDAGTSGRVTGRCGVLSSVTRVTRVTRVTQVWPSASPL